MFFKNKDISVFFGDNSSAPFFVNEFKANIDKNKDYLRNKLFDFPLVAKSYIFLHQIHSVKGKIFKSNFNSFDFCGDYLITKELEVAIGVLTADCLPVIFYDADNNVIAIAHVGWKGSLGGILLNVIEKLKSNFSTNLSRLKIWFGPCGKVCCYEVSSDFLKKLSQGFFKKSIVSRKQRYFFDNVTYSCLNLLGAGIQKSNINLDFNMCTICNVNFASHRRDAENSKRQVSLIKINSFK